jgi:hypothetical protein
MLLDIARRTEDLPERRRAACAVLRALQAPHRRPRKQEDPVSAAGWRGLGESSSAGCRGLSESSSAGHANGQSRPATPHHAPAPNRHLPTCDLPLGQCESPSAAHAKAQASPSASDGPPASASTPRSTDDPRVSGPRPPHPRASAPADEREAAPALPRAQRGKAGEPAPLAFGRTRTRAAKLTASAGALTVAGMPRLQDTS